MLLSFGKVKHRIQPEATVARHHKNMQKQPQKHHKTCNNNSINNKDNKAIQAVQWKQSILIS